MLRTKQETASTQTTQSNFHIENMQIVERSIEFHGYTIDSDTAELAREFFLSQNDGTKKLSQSEVGMWLNYANPAYSGLNYPRSPGIRVMATASQQGIELIENIMRAYKICRKDVAMVHVNHDQTVFFDKSGEALITFNDCGRNSQLAKDYRKSPVAYSAHKVLELLGVRMDVDEISTKRDWLDFRRLTFERDENGVFKEGMSIAESV